MLLPYYFYMVVCFLREFCFLREVCFLREAPINSQMRYKYKNNLLVYLYARRTGSLDFK